MMRLSEHDLKLARIMRDLGPETVNAQIVDRALALHPTVYGAVQRRAVTARLAKLRKLTGKPWWTIKQRDLDELVSAMEGGLPPPVVSQAEEMELASAQMRDLIDRYRDAVLKASGNAVIVQRDEMSVLLEVAAQWLAVAEQTRSRSGGA